MSARSRVLFLDHVGSLGGAELALLDVVAAYRETSTVALFADGPLRQRLEQAGARVEVIEGGSALQAVRRETRWPGMNAVSGALSLAMRVRSLARDHQCIHANSQKAFAIGCLAGALARRPVVWDLNDLLVPEHFSPLNIRVDVALANTVASRVIANSHASADALVAQGGPRRKIRVVHQGIDKTAFDAVTPADLEAVRDELQLAPGPLIGLFGRLCRWKGQHVALEALVNVPDAQLLLVGEALFGEQPYESLLRQRSEALGVADRVHFLGFRADIPRLMRFVDVVLHTSTAPEPFGRVIVEGMLAGRPVVATRAGGVAEILEQGVTGWMVSPGDAAELAQVLHQVLDDRATAQRVALAGRIHAETHFTVEAMVSGKSRCMEELAN